MVLLWCGDSDDGRRVLECHGLVGVEPDPDRGDLAADGLAGDHDRPLGRVQHERWARVDFNEAYGGPLVRARAGHERDESPAAFEELPHPLGSDNWVPGCAPGGPRVRYEHDVGVEEAQGLLFVACE